MEREEEAALFRRLRAGDVGAFDEIYEAFNRRLLTFLTRMAKSRAVAEDLVEETWLRLVSRCPDLDAHTELGPWLFTVARNLYFSHCRSRVRQQSYTADLVLLWPGELPQSPFDLALLSQFEERLEAAIALLPPIYREALLLVAVEQLRPVDAAAVCGITPETFRQRLSRARILISQVLNEGDRSGKEVCKEVRP